MSRADEIVERGSQQLRALAERAAERGGAVGRLAPSLAEDAVFLRKLKPSLIAARARGIETGAGAGSGPAPLPQPKASAPGRRRRGVGPVAVLAAALVAGVLTARLLDWRGHAHPRG